LFASPALKSQIEGSKMNTSRRLFLFTAAAAAPAIALPAIASPAPADTTALRLWAERQPIVDRIRSLCAAYNEANAKLPDWARPGHERVDTVGNPCGAIVYCPLAKEFSLPERGERIVRPSTWQAKENFEFAVRVFGNGSAAYREKARAILRQNVRAIVARLRERNALYESLGLIELDREITAACDALCAAEDAISELEQTPNVVAARLMARLAINCNNDSVADGNGYDGAMATALIALRGLLPSLSGLIREHAAFYVENPTTPLGAMPFATV
jgi:hypothetical protein